MKGRPHTSTKTRVGLEKSSEWKHPVVHASFALGVVPSLLYCVSVAC